MREGKLSLSFFLLFLFFLESASHAPRRQGDALKELVMDVSKLQRRSGYSGDVNAASASVLIDQAKVYSQDGRKDRDMIGELPGQPKGVEFRQYGGYVTVDKKAGRALFYYFVEAASLESSSKPLLLWLNGGPGCSSIGYGAMEELGPFRVCSDGKTLYRNPYAWNRVANVLFLESPAGVGYSYSNTTSDYQIGGDARTAEDAAVFMVNWLERFPEYKDRDFYIAGESYAGHYVPQLAHTILHRNQLSNNTGIIHLKGILIGNAVINDETDNRGMFDYFWTHGLISEDTINGIHKYCNFSPSAGETQDAKCEEALEEASRATGELDIYNIYAPLCFSSNLTATPLGTSVKEFDPCSDYYVDAYLNLEEVQEALHANVTRLDHSWSGCSGVLSGWQDSATTVLPILKELVANELQVWLFSGDIDGRVPITSTRYSVNELKLPVKTQWQPWNTNSEVGGYSVIYEGGLTLVTVRGAGHEVPSYQPSRALALIKSFIEGKPLPKS